MVFNLISFSSSHWFVLLWSKGLCSLPTSLCSVSCAPKPGYPSLFWFVHILFMLYTKRNKCVLSEKLFCDCPTSPVAENHVSHFTPFPTSLTYTQCHLCHRVLSSGGEISSRAGQGGFFMFWQFFDMLAGKVGGGTREMHTSLQQEAMPRCYGVM